jgi:hypothetical protein
MKEKLKKVKETLEEFREMHLENSKKYKEIYDEYQELTPTGDYKEKHDLAFKEVKEMLNRISKSDDEKSFVSYFSNSFIFTIGNPGREDLKWNKYTNIIKDSANYLKYFENLKKGATKIKSSYRTVFGINALNSFCSSIIAEFIE